MSVAVEQKEVPAQIMAAIRLRAKQQELSRVIPQACGKVWNLVKAAKLDQPGRMIALYLDCEINIECGVEVPHAFAGNDELVCSQTPAGLVATAAHIGPYQLLHATHRAICDWCAARGLRFAGPSWEVYGHWTEDETKLRTDVSYLLSR